MSDVDGLLERLRFRANCANDLGMFDQRDELTNAVHTIEQQRTEIERLRSQLSPRCSIPADMELDDVIVRFTNRTDEPSWQNCGRRKDCENEPN